MKKMGSLNTEKKNLEKAPLIKIRFVMSGKKLGVANQGGDGDIDNEGIKITSEIKPDKQLNQCSNEVTHIPPTEKLVGGSSRPKRAASTKVICRDYADVIGGNTRVKINNKENKSIETKRDKIYVSLSRSEIEEDFFTMTGQRPPLRPTKRPKKVQDNLDDVFPGLELTKITASKYKVSRKNG
ncbi:uncharacterized protein LOC124925146 [Impatiens glandulifera]|uniref:uncharacterized protein LOC124925146 n=1 Tax=Impatiens glandulifera TaxID=253017 RepID=UPI001FB1866F|nr:uncharacterized protein LOC124925146 [Impatiens glandulifera]